MRLVACFCSHLRGSSKPFHVQAPHVVLGRSTCSVADNVTDSTADTFFQSLLLLFDIDDGMRFLTEGDILD